MSMDLQNTGLKRDLSGYLEVGCALWADSDQSEQVMTETLSAISLMDLSREAMIERAASALLQQAIQQGAAANPRHLNQPFFRLPPEARFVLSALHLGNWSYGRVARILNTTTERVEELAWSARQSMGAETSRIAIGGRNAGPNCPEYDARRPWTQRFLDEEVRSGQERVFFQNHLMVCPSCQKTMNHCRDLYFAVERSLPRAMLTGDNVLGIERLEELCKHGRELSGAPSLEPEIELTGWQAFVKLLKQPDMVLVLSFCAALIGYGLIATFRR